jgi:hypothetical protein
MNAISESRLCRRYLAVVCYCFVLACSGCASYFRTGEMTTEDLQRKNQETQQKSKQWLTPGTEFYTQ